MCTGIVLLLQFYLPVRYTEKIQYELDLQAMKFVELLESKTLTETEMQDHILTFCLQNGTAAELFDKNKNSLYKVDLSQSILAENPVYSRVLTASFISGDENYTLDIPSPIIKDQRLQKS